jgi:hypothetical protein
MTVYHVDEEDGGMRRTMLLHYAMLTYIHGLLCIINSSYSFML